MLALHGTVFTLVLRAQMPPEKNERVSTRATISTLTVPYVREPDFAWRASELHVKHWLRDALAASGAGYAMFRFRIWMRLGGSMFHGESPKCNDTIRYDSGNAGQGGDRSLGGLA